MTHRKLCPHQRLPSVWSRALILSLGSCLFRQTFVPSQSHTDWARPKLCWSSRPPHVHIPLVQESGNSAAASNKLVHGGVCLWKKEAVSRESLVLLFVHFIRHQIFNVPQILLLKMHSCSVEALGGEEVLAAGWVTDGTLASMKLGAILGSWHLWDSWGFR